MAFPRVYLVALIVQLLAFAYGFYNPIRSAGQDPSVKFHGGSYYLVQSVGNSIVVYRSELLENLGNPDETVTVWTASGISGQDVCCEIWAPELVYYPEEDRFYIYFAADNGDNANHRSYCLQGAGNDPLGPYTFIGKMAATTDYWAIDASVLQLNGQNYYIWSGWPVYNVDNNQTIYIAAMSSPTAVTGDRYAISSPTQSWEIADGNHGVNEGPAPLSHDGNTYIAFSACGSWEDCYCLGLLTYVGGDPLSQSSWSKSTSCVFQSNPSESVYGPGHNSFTVSPDGTETWSVYHADVQSGAGWGGRSIRAQKVDWNGDDSPNFGTPVGFEQWVVPPSGEPQ